MSDAEQKPSDVKRPPPVWWSPTEGVVMRHPDDSEQYVGISGRDGAYLDGWPTDGKQLRAEHPDWHARALTWERMADAFGKSCDVRVADADAATARSQAEVADLRAQLARARDVPRPPDRAAAVREVEALLRRVHDVTEEADDVVRFYLAGDGAFLRDVHNMTAGELASLVVDAVLGQEET